MEIKELGSPAKNILWTALRAGLETLGEQFPNAEKAESGSNGGPVGEITAKPPMPIKVGLLLMIAVLLCGASMLGFVAIWEYYMNILPTRIVVLAPAGSTRKSRSYNLDIKGDDEESKADVPPQSNSIFKDWNFLPIYAFFMCSWLETQLISLATAFLPPLDVGRHILCVVCAVLLCPVQFLATMAVLGTTRTAKPKYDKTPMDEKPKEDESKDEKSIDDPSKKDSTPSPRSGRYAILAICGSIIARLYKWLAPITLWWAVSVELSKLGTLRLSRYLSLTQYANDPSLIEDTGSVAIKAACVLAVFISTWLSLALPATIAMRRVHASFTLFDDPTTLEHVPIDDRIRNQTNCVEDEFLSGPSAWRSLSWKSYRKLLVVYGTSFFLLALVAVGCMQLGLTMIGLSLEALVEGLGDSSDYLGWWASLGWYIKHGLTGLF